jgi:hypothetical protein
MKTQLRDKFFTVKLTLGSPAEVGSALAVTAPNVNLYVCMYFVRLPDENA